MKKEYEWAVVIGRFNPVHNAHAEIFNKALSSADKLVIVIGSHKQAPNPRNPFSTEDRIEMIKSTLSSENKDRVFFTAVSDYPYNNNSWLIEVSQKVDEITNYSNSICLVGHKSDFTSEYLNSFPSWKFIDYSPSFPFHATKIRELYFTQDVTYSKHIHKNVAEWLERFKNTKQFSSLKDNFDELVSYREKWRGAPFKPTFNTVDAVVVKSGHILVCRRGGKYGRGLFCLPGGFIEESETQREAAVRELKEETSIDLSYKDLNSSIVCDRVYDDPMRSLRGRTITRAFYFDLGIGYLPKTKGGSDAEKTWWAPLSEFYTMQDQLFEDHYHIVYDLLHRGR